MLLQDMTNKKKEVVLDLHGGNKAIIADKK